MTGRAALLAAIVPLIMATHPAAHQHVRYCQRSDWGATQEWHGRWYLCNPDGRRFRWYRMPPGRNMAS